MTFEEFKECYKKLSENVDRFVKQNDKHSLKIRNYLKISQDVINTLEGKIEKIKEIEKSNLIKIWKKHIEENAKYGYEELKEEIERKISEFDALLKKDMQKLEDELNEAKKANKRL